MPSGQNCLPSVRTKSSPDFRDQAFSDLCQWQKENNNPMLSDGRHPQSLGIYIHVEENCVNRKVGKFAYSTSFDFTMGRLTQVVCNYQTRINKKKLVIPSSWRVHSILNLSFVFSLINTKIDKL
jgi:hypothetical protein